jgi:Mycotoxin biosynthesis protein UstYa
VSEHRVIRNKPHSDSFQEPSAALSTERQGRAAIWIDDTVHYDLRGSTADVEYLHLVPPVSFEDPEAEFSPTAMIHQLQCLQVIQADYGASHVSEMTQHCMEYLRQSILCSADTRLESVRFSHPPHVVSLPGEYECKDWSDILETL